MSRVPSTLCAGCELDGKVRCGACHKAGVEVRYCGAKCQRTLWKVHRHYCGKPADIFYQPPLEKYEVSITTLKRASEFDLRLPAITQILTTYKVDSNQNSVNPERDQVVAAGMKYLDSPLATKGWEDHLEEISLMEPSLVQAQIAVFRCTVSNFYRARDGQLGAFKSYPYSPYGMIPGISRSISVKELSQWQVVMSDFNWACLNYACVEDELQNKDPALVSGPRARNLWKRMRTASKIVSDAGNGRFNVEWEKQDKMRLALLGE